MGTFLSACNSVMSLKSKTRSTKCVVTIAENGEYPLHEQEIDLNDNERWMELILTYG